MKIIKLICVIIALHSSSIVRAQYYDGYLDGILKLGYEPGETSYAIIGGELGLNRYLSFGLTADYLLSSREMPTVPSTDREGPFAYSFRVDLHSYNIFNFEKSDFLIGYNRKVSTSGVHFEYRYFLNEFFAFYGRSKYHFDYPQTSFLSEDFRLESKLRLEVGIIFKTVSGNSYDTQDW